MKRLVATLLAIVSLVTVGVVVVAAIASMAAAAAPADPCAAESPVPSGAGTGPALATSAAFAAGFRGEDLIMAVAIAGAESSYRPTIRNSIGASGLWQILQSAHQDLFARYDWRDPAQNAVMAFSVWAAASRSWTPWTTFTGGSYRAHLEEARSAVSLLVGPPGPGKTSGSPNVGAPLSVSTTGTTPQTAAGSDASSPPVCPPAAGGLPPAPRPFTGPDGYVDDPTSSGRITRRMLHTYTEVNRAFGGRWPWGIGCWDPHAWNPTSDHPKGKACDFTVGQIGSRPNPSEHAIGWQLAQWLQTHAAALGISYVIWDGRIWSPTRSTEGWRPYGGGGVYNPRSITGGHLDHLHASVG